MVRYNIVHFGKICTCIYVFVFSFIILQYFKQYYLQLITEARVSNLMTSVLFSPLKITLKEKQIKKNNSQIREVARIDCFFFLLYQWREKKLVSEGLKLCIVP